MSFLVSSEDERGHIGSLDSAPTNLRRLRAGRSRSSSLGAVKLDDQFSTCSCGSAASKGVEDRGDSMGVGWIERAWATASSNRESRGPGVYPSSRAGKSVENWGKAGQKFCGKTEFEMKDCTGRTAMVKPVHRAASSAAEMLRVGPGEWGRASRFSQVTEFSVAAGRQFGEYVGECGRPARGRGRAERVLVGVLE